MKSKDRKYKGWKTISGSVALDLLGLPSLAHSVHATQFQHPFLYCKKIHKVFYDFSLYLLC